MSERIRLDVDTTQAHQEISAVEQYAQRVAAQNRQMEQEALQSMMRVMAVARTSYLATAAFIRAGGTSVSYYMTALISAGLTSITILTPLIQATLAEGLASLNPYMVLQAIISLTNIGLATYALVEAQSENSKIASQIASAREGMNNISTILGGMHYF